MKKTLLSIFIIVFFQYSYAQCPPAARAFHSLWVYTYESGGNWITDTSCTVIASHLPPNSTVYLYNTAAVLLDSFTTNATGYGTINLSPNRCLTYGVGSIVGTIVCGTCTINIAGVGLLPIKIKYFAITTADNKVTAEWQLQEEINGVKYTLQESNNGRDFTNIYTISNTAASLPGRQYQYQLPQVLVSKKFYRLMITENTRAFEYSDIKTALPKGYSAMDIYPTISNGKFSATVPANFINGEIKIFNTTGSLIQTKKITNIFVNVMLTSGKGLYYIKASATDGTILIKTILVQ